MTPDELRELCLGLPQAIETFPFGEETSVFRTSGNEKIFALSDLSSEPLRISVKIDPQDALALREEYPAITPGYHLNKKHWVTVIIGGVPEDLVEQVVRDSHALVRPKVPRSRSLDAEPPSPER